MTVARARNLRRAMSPPEVALWQYLRARPGGFKFRRQHPLGPYILDFFCRSAALSIEVDGISHDMGDNPRRDERRDRWLFEQGIKTIRFPASDVLNDLESVAVRIVEECLSRTPHSSPAFAGESSPSSPAFAGEGDHAKHSGGAKAAGAPQ